MAERFELFVDARAGNFNGALVSKGHELVGIFDLNWLHKWQVCTLRVKCVRVAPILHSQAVPHETLDFECLALAIANHQATQLILSGAAAELGCGCKTWLH